VFGVLPRQGEAVKNQYAKRKDVNHEAVENALRSRGLEPLDWSKHSGLGCDIAVFTCGFVCFIEVKNGKRAKMTDAEMKLQAQCAKHDVMYRRVDSEEEAEQLADWLVAQAAAELLHWATTGATMQ
jgi:hypothetical protein